MDVEPAIETLALDAIETAHRRIRKHLAETSLTRIDDNLAVKPEYLQPSGSFKIRGALNCILQLTSEQKRRGVVAYSTGNHAQAVALAAKGADVPATIVMSPDVPDYKVSATRRLG